MFGFVIGTRMRKQNVLNTRVAVFPDLLMHEG